MTRSNIEDFSIGGTRSNKRHSQAVRHNLFARDALCTLPSFPTTYKKRSNTTTQHLHLPLRAERWCSECVASSNAVARPNDRSEHNTAWHGCNVDVTEISVGKHGLGQQSQGREGNVVHLLGCAPHIRRKL